MKHVITSVLGKIAAIEITAYAVAATAAPFAYESFEEAEAGALNAQSGGTGFSQPWVAQSAASVVDGNMSYSSGDISINGGNSYLRFKVSSQTAVFSRKIPTDAFPSDGSDIYISMLVRLPESAVAENDPDYFMVALSTSATDTPSFGPLFGPNEDVGNVFGIRQAGNVFTSAVPAAGTTHLVVFKVSKKDKSYYQYASLIVDPSTSSEPEIGQWNIRENYNSGFKNGISSYCYLQGFVKYKSDDSQKCESDDVFEIDEVRLATSWSDAVCASDYGGIVPPPYFSISESGMSKTVSILNSIPGMTHYYTTDGTEPTAETGTAYSSPFSVSSYAVVKAIAVDAGGNASKSASVICSLESRWVGDGADYYWTTTGNWSPSGSPEGRSIVFGAEDRTKDSIVNSVISQDTTVRSLLFTNNSFAPAVVTPNYYWHVISIGEGKTLTVNGRDENGYVFRMWSPTRTGEPSMAAKFTGGGRLVIDSPDAEFLTQFNSSDNKATTTLNLAGLSEFDCTASVFTFCRGRRAKGTLALAKTGIGKNTFTLDAFYLTDMRSDDQGGDTVSMQLGSENVFNSDIFYIGAPSAGYNHAQPAAVSFASGLTNPTVKIRAKDGLGRADMKVGSHGTNVDATPRSMNATADFSAGSVDAKVGDFVVGNGRGYHWSNQYGALSATFKMSAGTFDTLSTVVGRTEYTSGTRNVEAKPCTGTFSLSGGDFTVQGNFAAAENSVGAFQSVKANISVSGGALDIGGNMPIATRHGCATNVVANLEVSGGTLSVKGAFVGGEDDQNYTGDYTAEKVNVAANVTAAGGVMAVTNDQGSAELRIESGTLALHGGKVYADSLVLTNAASCMEVVLSGDGFATAEVGVARLGGTIKVSIADGFDPHGASEWTIVDGTLPRVGVFAAVELPKDYKVKYTPTGFMVANKSGLTIIVR